MTHRIRNIIFIVFLILFLIAAPITVFYSLGWRFDWETKKIVQTGIFYFKIWPKSSQIYINGELKKKTDIFFDSALIDNLLPGKYDVEIKKDGYYDWRKNLSVEKRQATEIKNIVLIPEACPLNIVAGNIEDFFFSPDNKKIVLKEIGTAGKENKWGLKLYEFKNGLKSHIVDETDFSKTKVDLLDLKFSLDSQKILLQLGLKENISYYLLGINDSPATITKLDFVNAAEKLYFHPQDANKLFMVQTIEEEKSSNRKTTTLNEVDISNKEILPPLLKNIITLSAAENNIYYLDDSGSVFKTDLSGKNKEKLNITDFPYKKETDYELIISKEYIFLKEMANLYFLNQENRDFQKIFDSLKNYKFSPDNKKMAYYSDNEIRVLFLEKQYDQPIKEKGENLFITRFSETIGDLFWYTNNYLIFNVGDKIKISEIDDRDKINIYDLAESESSQLRFNNKKLYIFSKNILYSSNPLTP